MRDGLWSGHFVEMPSNLLDWMVATVLRDCSYRDRCIIIMCVFAYVDSVGAYKSIDEDIKKIVV